MTKLQGLGKTCQREGPGKEPRPEAALHIIYTRYFWVTTRHASTLFIVWIIGAGILFRVALQAFQDKETHLHPPRCQTLESVQPVASQTTSMGLTAWGMHRTPTHPCAGKRCLCRGSTLWPQPWHLSGHSTDAFRPGAYL